VAAGISNQMLAGIALARHQLIKMKRQRYIWVFLRRTGWLLICTTTAGLHRCSTTNPAIGPSAVQQIAATRQVLASGQATSQMQHVIFNAAPTHTLTLLFAGGLQHLFVAKVGIAAGGQKERTDKEPIPGPAGRVIEDCAMFNDRAVNTSVRPRA
jgi:carbon starvation protein